jgi:hypothetical protein
MDIIKTPIDIKTLNESMSGILCHSSSSNSLNVVLIFLIPSKSPISFALKSGSSYVPYIYI